MRSDFNEYLANDYGVLRRYMGEVRFNALAADCIASQSSLRLNARAYSAKLPERIATFHTATAELAELAMLERALRDAFEVADTNMVEFADQRLVFLHPSVKLLSFTQNTVSIWSSLTCGEPPPRPYRLDSAQRVLVWRHNARPRMRLLGEEEFSLLATMQDDLHEVAPTTAHEAYLRGWLDTEVLAAGSRVEAEK